MIRWIRKVGKVIARGKIYPRLHLPEELAYWADREVEIQYINETTIEVRLLPKNEPIEVKE